ncbi:MAG: MBL fold metallo-hydrolase [Pseudomonadota bacterium]
MNVLDSIEWENLVYKVDFHPVGQGLFSSGTIHSNGTAFNYVYDCGTSSGQRLIDKAIQGLKDSFDKLDMVVVSHFDKDHISGLKNLLPKFPVKIVLLPEMSLAQRLVVAFSEGVEFHSPHMDFFLDPVAYLTSLPGSKVEHIILVSSSNNETLKEPIHDQSFSNDPQDIPDVQANFKGPHEQVNGSFVHVLSEGSSLILEEAKFEFLPYNDEFLSPKIPDEFVKQVEKEKKILRKVDSVEKEIDNSLKRLRNIYDKKFGASSKRRNAISLFLYAGPTVVLDGFQHTGSKSSNVNKFHSLSICEKNKTGVLYTGDGYLNTEMRINSLQEFLGSVRVDNIACFQVMHHGAESSWKKGVASAFSPNFSIFSSDPEHSRLKHPHQAVARDFLPYGPVQVDKNHSFSFGICKFL